MSSVRKTNPGAEAAVSTVTSMPTVDDNVLEEKPPRNGDEAELASTQLHAPTTSNITQTRDPTKTEKLETAEPKQGQKGEDTTALVMGRQSRAASRSSKPATPLSTAFSDVVQLPRPRSTRNGGHQSNGTGSPIGGPSSPKRSQKRTGNGTSVIATESPPTSEEPDESKLSRKAVIKRVDDREVEGDTPAEDLDVNDDNEERYCTCNGVSFGNMIACDNNHCPTEWFHLECVGLTRAPTGKWFCSDRCRNTARRGR